MTNFYIIKLFFLVLLIIAVPACDSDQQAKNPVKIGILSGIELFLPTIEGFKQEMAQMGYIEGKNVLYVSRSAKGDVKRMKEIAEEFAKSDIDLLFTTTNGGVIAANKALEGKDVPVVFTIVLAPVTSGVVDSLSTPSNNITGVRNPLDEFIGKRIEYLVRLAPEVKNIWAPRMVSYPTIPITNIGLRAAAKQMDINLIETSVKEKSDVIVFLDEVSPSSLDAILILPDPVVQHPDSLDAMFSFGNKHNIPIVASSPQQLEKGALFSYNVDDRLVGVQAASLVDKILKNRNPTSMSILNSEPILYLNSKAIKRLGFTLAEELEALAEEIL
ncbi:MAG: hypothetical protein GY786_19050 [Proteobacteria bacterium]|nr:hypothetical protein [Pseudomonadota bacterium]